MNLRRQIKLNARRALSGNWGRAISLNVIILSIFLIFSLLQGMAALLIGVPDFQDILSTPQYYLDDVSNLSLFSILLSGLFLLVSLLVSSPLSFGLKQWFLALVGGENSEIVSIFSFFGGVRLFLKTIWYDINLVVRSTLWCVLFSAVPGAVCGFSYALLLRPGITPAMQFIGILLMTLGALLLLIAQVFLTIFLNRYFLAPYLIIEHPDLSVRAAIKQSIQIMKGRRVEIFLLRLTFLPWLLLSVLILPLLYVWPYWNASSALYAKYYLECSKSPVPEQGKISPTDELPLSVEGELPLPPDDFSEANYDKSKE